MTREEAIAELKLFKGHTFIKTEEAIDMAIKALEQNEQAAEWYKTFVEKFDSCDDAISRQVIDEIKELMTDINGDTVYAARVSDIRQLPSVNPQPKTGHWELDVDFGNVAHYYCSECRQKRNWHTPYCPNCGAKMGSEDKK